MKGERIRPPLRARSRRSVGECTYPTLLFARFIAQNARLQLFHARFIAQNARLQLFHGNTKVGNLKVTSTYSLSGEIQR